MEGYGALKTSNDVEESLASVRIRFEPYRVVDASRTLPEGEHPIAEIADGHGHNFNRRNM